MVTFKDKHALVGRAPLIDKRVKETSQLKLPVYAEPRQRIRFSYKDGYFQFLGKKVTKQDALLLAKWILTHE